MATEFPLPDVGEGLAEAEIVRWLVAEGDAVRADDEIVEVETDKALVQITSPVTGTLVRHGAAEGQVVPVGALLAVFEDGTGTDAGAGDGADTPEASSTDGDVEAAASEATTSPAAAATSKAGTGAAPRKPKATPATRKLARQLGVDLTTVEGTGPAGRIVDADVQRAADGDAPSTAAPSSAEAPQRPAASREQGPAPEPVTPPEGEDRRVPMRGIRKAVSRTMTRSWETVPHINSMHEIDLQALTDLRAQLKQADRDIPLSAFLVKAAARALREFPVLNAEVDADAEEIVLKHRVNVGVAVDAPDGLIVPVIDDADVKSAAAIGRELRELAAQARDRTLPQERLRGGSFTVNNYGPLGGWFGTSLIKPPEVGIASLGPARDQVVPRDGEIVIRPVAVLSLAADHRVADGREVIGFCLAIRQALEAPAQLIVED